MITPHDTTRRPRPVAIALVEAFDRAMELEDLRDMDDDDLLLFVAMVTHWDVLARGQPQESAD